MRSIADFRRWKALLEEIAPDLIHAHAESAARAITLAAHRCHIPLLCHVHLMMPAAAAHYLTRGLPSPDGFIFVSGAQHRLCEPNMTSAIRRAPHHVLHNPVAVDLPLAPEPAAPPFRVGIVSNLAPQKRHEDFLAIAAGLVARGYDCVFDIIGGDSNPPGRLALLQGRAAELGIAERIRFSGFTDQVHNALLDLNVFVLTSDKESGPLVVTEAMAAARAVVSTIIGATPEMIVDGESGFLAEPGDVDALTRLVAELLDSTELRAKIATAGRERVVQRFSPESQIHALIGIYEATLGGTAET